VPDLGSSDEYSDYEEDAKADKIKGNEMQERYYPI
jgi:hypothetical protein